MRKYKRVLFVAVFVCLMTIFMPSCLFALIETGGIGIRVAQLYNRTAGISNHRGSLVVLDVFRHSAAERAGIEKGDVILKVDDVVTKDLYCEDLVENHLRSPSFTEVTLIIWRSSTKDKLTIIIMREPTIY
jgi:C-terminal processing protease CtpA/Prc